VIEISLLNAGDIKCMIGRIGTRYIRHEHMTGARMFVRKDVKIELQPSS